MTFDSIPELKAKGLKALEYMKNKGYKIRALNIVYFEGIDTDLATVNSDYIDQWNDVRAIITDDGDVLMAAQATTEPGRYYTHNRMNIKGAFRIAFGQYLDCWRLGKHFKQDALVQCGELLGYRDDNEDGKRTGDSSDLGDYFGVNQHTTGDYAGAYAPETVGRYSAGCLVGRYPSTHYNVFLPICRSMGLKTFDTTIIDGSDFLGFCRL